MRTMRKTIMMVDDNITNLSIGKQVLKEIYDVYTLPSGEKLFQLIEKKRPDLILLDVEMPGLNGYDVIKILKSKESTKEIPVIFLTARSDAESELEGFSLGAIDYIRKPFSPPLLLKRIETYLLVFEQKKALAHYNANLQAMVDEKTKTVFELQNAVLKIVAEMVEYRDDITGGHIERTQKYIEILLREMMQRGIYEKITQDWSLDFLIQSSQLHDVGKIGIKDSILMKNGKLTTDEFNVMKKHTIFGVNIIEEIENNTQEHDFLRHAKIFAGTHHEKWNGSGYPYGLSEQEIPLQGRIMAIADVYDALISVRPYKKAMEHSTAVDIILEGKGSHFDPLLVDLFTDISDQFYYINETSHVPGGVLC